MENERILRLLRYVLAGLTFIALCLASLRPIEDPDFFWHLSTGRWIIEHLSLPTHDSFNYTTPSLLSSREHFILTSYWLSQILYYGIYYVSGWNGFILLRFVLLGFIIYFVYKRAKGSDSTVLFSMMAITMVVFFIQIYPLERPQIFSFIFFAILLYLLEKQVKAEAEVKKKNLNLNLNLNLFLLPLLMLIWANMHGGFILGQVVILVYLIAEGLKFLHPSLRPMGRYSYQRFVIAGAAGILSSLINPNTYKAVTLTWSMSQYISSMNIMEHLSTITYFKYYYNYIAVYWLLLLIAAMSLLYRIVKRRFDIQDIVMLAGLGYFSFTQLRYVAFFLIWATPFISVSLTQLMQDRGGGDERVDRGGQKPLLRYICICLSLLIVAVLVIRQKEYNNAKNISNFGTGQWVSNYFPEDAVSFIIQNDIKGNMYNYLDWGGYLIWRFYREKKVFADTRNLYVVEHLLYRHIRNATLEPKVMGMPYYKAILDSYRVRYMVIPLFARTGEMLPIVGEMINDKEWVPVFLKVNTMVFVKDTPENYDVIQTYSIPKDVFVADLFAMLDTVIKWSPGVYSFHLAKGDLYLSQRMFKEAREEYEKLLRINPFNPAAEERLELFDRNYPR